MYVAGTGVDVVGEGIAAALGPLTAGFGINSGQDSAGMMFGLAYQNAARSLLTGIAAAINACRKGGATIQLCASNYSRAEAASKVGGGGHVLPSPAQPAIFSPPNPPGVVGPGIAQPLLWGLVESLLDDVWPNGNAVGMHAAAGCWRGLGASLHGVQDALNGPKSAIAAQQIPEGEKVQQYLTSLADIVAKLGAQCDKQADTLDNFANEVEDAQNNIRDLLCRLGALADLAHDVMLIFEGDALDELERIANDINGVLHNMKREAQAREQVLKTGMQIIDGLVQKGKSIMQGEFVEFFGEDVGSVMASDFNFVADFGEGIFKGAVGVVGLEGQLDPTRFVFDPKGAAASWAALDQTAFKSIPAYALFDPGGAAKNDLGLVKGLVHWDDLTSDRPAVGLGEIAFDAGTMVGGGGAAKAGAKAADAAGGVEASEEFAEGERAAQGAAGAAGEMSGAGGALADIEKTGGNLTKDLQNLGGDLPKGDPPPSGDPVGLPPGKLPETPVESTPRTPDAPPGTSQAPTTGPTAPGGGPHDPAPAPASAPTSSPSGPGGPRDPASVPSGGPHEPASVPAEQPREPVSVPARGAHEPASEPSGGPRETASAPAGSRLASAGDGLPSATPQLLDHSSARVPVSASGSSGEAAPIGAHSPAPSPSSAAPRYEAPRGRPAELPTPSGGGGHGPGDGGPPGGHESSHSDDDTAEQPRSPDGFVGPYPLPAPELLTPPPDGAFFWSGRTSDGIGIGPTSAGGNGSADLYAASHSGTTLEGLLERNGITPPKWSFDDPAAEEWWSKVSETYAANSRGEIRAVIGSDLRPGGVWQSVELPRLMNNPNVTKIVIIDPETGAETTIFER